MTTKRKVTTKVAKIDAQDIPDVEELDGYKLLTPVYKLRPSVATKILACLDDNATSAMQAAQAVEAVEAYAVTDEDGWVELYQSEGLEAILTLALAYVVKLVGGND